jgi:hypothetical protein
LLELKQMEPSPAPGSEFVFRGLPDTIRGVFFFHAGLNEAVNLTFDRRDLSARREVDRFQPPVGNGKSTIKMQWVGRSDALLERIRD